MLNSARNTKRDKKSKNNIFTETDQTGPIEIIPLEEGQVLCNSNSTSNIWTILWDDSKMVVQLSLHKKHACVRQEGGWVGFVCKRGCQGICENYPLSLEDVCWCAGLVSSNFWNKILLNLRVKMISYRYYQLLATNFNSRNYKSFGHKS